MPLSYFFFLSSPPSLSHYHSLLFPIIIFPCRQHLSIHRGELRKGIPPPHSSSLQSHHLWSIVFVTGVGFKRHTLLPEMRYTPCCNNSRTWGSQFSRSPYLSVSDWICFYRFIGSFVFHVVSGYLTGGVVLWIVSSIPSDTEQSAVLCNYCSVMSLQMNKLF